MLRPCITGLIRRRKIQGYKTKKFYINKMYDFIF